MGRASVCSRGTKVLGEKAHRLNKQKDKLLTLFRWLAVVAVLVVGFRLAWLSDDALITLRTALNITHGWGPGFNATESVQAYTHPLWFLLWVLIGVTTDQWVWGILLAGIFMTAGAVGILAWRTESIARIILLTGMLIFSNGFIEYSTSGLENPMGYLSVALAFALSVSIVAGKSMRWWLLPLLTGLTFAAVFLTRFDLILLILPVGLLLVVNQRKSMRTLIVAAVAFLTPVIIWFSWSWVTYHTLFPNTFAAKRNVAIPQIELAVQGFRYFYISFEHDPVILILLTLGIFAGFIFGSLLVRAWTLGIVIYFIYVLSIGGDFMASRFMAIPALISALILASIPIRGREVSPDRDPLVMPGVSVVILTFLALGANLSGSTPTALANYQSQRWEFEQNTNAGVADERGWYIESDKSLKGLLDRLSLAYIHPDIVPLTYNNGIDRSLREISKAAQNWPVNDGGFTNPSEVGAFCGGLGFVGIATGPITHLVDFCALTDRFLAQQPFTPREPFAWRVGHLERAIPEGYLDALAVGDPTKVVDPQLALQLEQLWAEIRK